MKTHQDSAHKGKQLVLVDGSGYLFRAFYAMPALTSPDGHPTGAIYGVLNMLKRLERKYPEASRVVVFDPKGQTQRHDLYPAYKANRGAMPEDLQSQIAPLQDAIKALGWPVCVLPGIEADDVMGTLATRALQEGYNHVLLCSGDKDFAQLVGPNLTIYDGMKEKTFDADGVKEKFGVWPGQIIDYLALVGDSVDNIPGVEKVGPKTAVKWLETYGDIATLVANMGALKGKIVQNLAEAVPHLDLYKRLVTIQCDLDLDVCLSDFDTVSQDLKALAYWYETLGFKTWHKALRQDAQPSLEKALEVETIETAAKWCEVCQECEVPKESLCTLNFFTLPDRSPGAVLGVMVGVEGQAWYLPWALHLDGKGILTGEAFFVGFGLLLEKTAGVITFEGKRLWRLCLQYGALLEGRLEDLTVMGYLEKGPGRLRVDQLVYDRLSLLVPMRTDAFGQGAKQVVVETLGYAHVTRVLGAELSAMRSLYAYFQELWKTEDTLERLYRTIDGPLIEVLARMEHRGVLLDVPFLESMSLGVADKIKELEAKAHVLGGQSFNLSSPKQLQALFYDTLGWPVLEKTPTGQPSTGESVLHLLAKEYPLAAVILEYRSLSKLKSTYLDALPKCVDETGRIHADFLQTMTSTGRLSCQDPNVQNIPIRTEEGRKVRKAFKPALGFVLLALDYSQIELRIMAHISKDPMLLQAFAKDEDVHLHTASELYEVPPEEVTSEMRRVAKVINFGIIYGMSAFGLSKQLDISREQASSMIEKYFQRYTAIEQTMSQTREYAKTYAYVETILGRKIHLPDIRHGQQSVRRAQERAAINAPMQGTAAEIIKCAMLKVMEVMKAHAPEDKAYLILQVHDELVFEIHSDYVEVLREKIYQAMGEVMELDVPLRLSVNSGQTWEDAHA